LTFERKNNRQISQPIINKGFTRRNNIDMNSQQTFYNSSNKEKTKSDNNKGISGNLYYMNKEKMIKSGKNIELKNEQKRQNDFKTFYLPKKNNNITKNRLISPNSKRQLTIIPNIEFLKKIQRFAN